MDGKSKGDDKKMIQIIEGDILKADADVICHQVNCQGVMGSGLAKQVREMYPEVFTAYKQYCNKSFSEILLGNVQCVETHNGRIVANLFGQQHYGNDGRTYTSYPALENCLKTISERVVKYGESVAIPYNIGCGLGGGDWKVVYRMIEKAFGDYDKVCIYKLDK